MVHINKDCPNGYVVDYKNSENFLIHYKIYGIQRFNIIMIIWLVGWIFICIFLLKLYLKGLSLIEGEPILLGVVAIFWIIGIAIATFLLYASFVKRTFYFNQNWLTIETNILGLIRKKQFNRNELNFVKQLSDTGFGFSNSPFVWRLILELNNESYDSFFGQPYENSHWLGLIIANWANVKLIEDTKE